MRSTAARCCSVVVLGVLVLVALAGCRADQTRLEVCKLALATVLGRAPQEFSFEERPASDERDVIRLTLADGAGTVHRGSCSFAPESRFRPGPVLRSVVLDGLPLSMVRLELLGVAIGVAAEPPEVATPPSAVPSGRVLPYFVQELINGLVLGAVLALVAVGYSLVYGVVGTIQFAYGEIFAIGAFLTIILMTISRDAGLTAGLGVLLLVGLAAALLTAAWGWVSDRTVYRPLRDAGRLTPLIAGVGLATFLENGLRLTQGANDKWLDAIFTGRHVLFERAGFTVIIGDTQIVVLALALALGAVVAWVIGRSRAGRIYRACADDYFMAQMVGVNVDKAVGATFAAGAALAALGGLIVAVYYGEADASMGFLVGFKALTAALLGGFGSLPGAVVGGFAIGLLETLWTAYLGYAYKDVAVFGVLCLVLIYRPQGLFGLEEA